MFRPASYRCMDPLTILAVGGAMYSGYSSYEEGKEQKKQYEEQARIAEEESAEAVEAKESERRRLLANQRMAYLANGVSLAGTPLIVGEETRMEYQKEINALRRSGAAEVNTLQAQGFAAEKSGRTKLITSLMTAGGTYAKSTTPKARSTTTGTKTYSSIFSK